MKAIPIIFIIIFILSCSSSEYEKMDLDKIVIKEYYRSIENECYTKGYNLGELDNIITINKILYFNNSVYIFVEIDSSYFISNYNWSVYSGIEINDTICLNSKIYEKNSTRFNFQYLIKSPKDIICIPFVGHVPLLLDVGNLYKE